MNVQTRVGKEFLNLIDKHFPKGSPLSKFVNRNTIKISYKCAPNMGTHLPRHNAKIMKNYVKLLLCHSQIRLIIIDWGFGLGIGIGDWDWGLGFEIGIRIGEWNLRLRLGIGN